MESLWPKNILETGDIDKIYPLVFLKRQADYLGQITNNLVIGEVKTITYGEDFLYKFLIKSSVLSGTYELFWMRHKSEEIFPVTVEFGGHSYDKKNKEELEEFIKEIFHHSKTRNVVRNYYIISEEQDG